MSGIKRARDLFIDFVASTIFDEFAAAFRIHRD